MNRLPNFLKSYPIKKYEKGAVILQQGIVPTSVYVVKSGFVKVYNITAQGEERPVLFDVTYEAFPIGWIFDKINQTYFYYEAFTDVELYLVPKEDYIGFLKSQPEQMWRALDYYVERHVNYQLRMHALEQSKAREKILYTLEFLARRFGIHTSEGRHKITLPLTQQDFANFIGLSRETTSIELSKLQRENVISYDKQSYSIDPLLLRNLLEEI